ncbi:hypothetical protein FE257_003137 [Aspergillus nanangensis]|uniref:Uncharacterized protein n=1 Tax=Aspergillus nanangensis TaxID=2582783 RepID=A0AAD4GNQ2_ASPNN|nr:hypothetical protein FE257_003137 [Aspergillus nanangensis]
MPILLPHHLPHHQHRRRHSWPYCGPGKRPLPIIKVTAPEEDENEKKTHFLTEEEGDDDESLFLYDPEDDASSAGIVRSPPLHSHHNHHHPLLLWPHTSPKPHPPASTTTTDDDQYSLSGASSRTTTLRRIIRPPLDKARSLFTVPTTNAAGQNVLVSYWVARQGARSLSTAGPTGSVSASEDSERGRRRRLGDELLQARRLERRRNHRRCHSEQPRAWREPSAGLWTLLEE